MRPWRAALALAACGALPALAQEEAALAPPPDIALPALTAPLAAKARLLDLTEVGTRLVALGEQGVIVVSDDGRQWRQVPAPVGVTLTRLRFLDQKLGWAVGYDASILHSKDGGLSWTLQYRDPAARPLFDVLFLDARNGIAVGGFGLYLTTQDGGQHWQPQASPLAELGQHFNRLLRLNDGTLFIAGERGLLGRSKDKGASWQMLLSPYAGTFFGAMMLDGERVLAFGMRGNAYVADNLAACPTQDPAKYDPYAAETVSDPAKITALGWRKLESPTRESLLGGALLPGGEALLVGINGTVVRTELAAGRLTALRTKAEQTLTDVVSYQERLIAVGKLGVQDLKELK